MIGTLIAGLVPTALGALAGTAPQLFTKTRTEDRVNNIYSSSGNPALAGNTSGASASIRQERYKETIEEPTTFAKIAPWLGLAGGAAGALMPGLKKPTAEPTAEKGITEGKKGRKIVSIEPIEGKQHEEGGEDVEVGGEKVEAEGGEFKVVFDDGTEAVLTAEQMERLKQGEDIESIVQELPTVEEAKKDAQTNDLMQGGSQILEQGEGASEGAVMARRGILQDDPLYKKINPNPFLPANQLPVTDIVDTRIRKPIALTDSTVPSLHPDAKRIETEIEKRNRQIMEDIDRKFEQRKRIKQNEEDRIKQSQSILRNTIKSNPLIPKDNPLFGRELITDKGLQSGTNNPELSFSDPITPSTFAQYPTTTNKTISTINTPEGPEIPKDISWDAIGIQSPNTEAPTSTTNIPVITNPSDNNNNDVIADNTSINVFTPKTSLFGINLKNGLPLANNSLSNNEYKGLKNVPLYLLNPNFMMNRKRLEKEVYPIEESIKDLNRASLASNALIAAGTIASNIGNNVPDFTPSPLQAYDPVNIERVNPNAVLANINKQANTAMRATTEMGKDPTKALGAIFDASNQAIGQVNQANLQAGQSEASINQQGANQVKGMNAEINRFNKASKYQNELDKITQKTQRRQAMIDSIGKVLQSYVGGKSMLTQDMINRIAGEYGDDYGQVLVPDKQAVRRERKRK